MSELRDLYQEVILDHGRRPRNFKVLDGANRKAEGYNPLCGDRFTVYLEVEDGVVKSASFQGSGCAISTASASMMTEMVKGRTEQGAQALFHTFHEMVAPGASIAELRVCHARVAHFTRVGYSVTPVNTASLPRSTLGWPLGVAAPGATIS